MSKPLVFNYGHYENLKDQAKDMALEIEELRERVKSLEEENVSLNRIIDTQAETVKTYSQVFTLQEAELERLRNDSKLQDNQQKV